MRTNILSHEDILDENGRPLYTLYDVTVQHIKTGTTWVVKKRFSDFTKLYDELKLTHTLDGYVLPGKTLLHTFSDATKESRRVEFVKFLRNVIALEPLPACARKFLKVPNLREVPNPESTIAHSPTHSSATPTERKLDEDEDVAPVVISPAAKPKKGSKLSIVLVLVLYALVYFRIINIDVSAISPVRCHQMDEDKVWTSNPEDCLPIKMHITGPGAREARTTTEMFKRAVKNNPDSPAMRAKRSINGVFPEEWKTWTWSEYYDECTTFARALISLDVKPHKCTNILGFNSPEWLIAYNGTIMAAAIPAGIYATNLPAACKYISSHSQAEVVVCDGNAQARKFVVSADSPALPHLKAIVVWTEDDDPLDRTLTEQCGGVPVYTFDEFLQLGAVAEGTTEKILRERIKYSRPGHCASIIYTSGTTGPPKGAMLSHDNITWCCATLLQSFMEGLTSSNDRIVSYLPLSHVVAQLVDVHAPIFTGGCTYFARRDALKGTLSNTLREVRPTIFFGVPRVWEKIQEKMMELGRQRSAMAQRVAAWAKAKGTARSEMAQYGQSGGSPICFGCANSVVLSKVKGALGLDQCYFAVCGAAPMAVDTLKYFASLDIHIYEGFGQSECSGPHTLSCEGSWKIGYCGRPMPGTESYIDEGTKELCYRGRHIFMGYIHMPEQTAEAIDEDGFLHSGDIAEFDGNDCPGIPSPSGFMKITGRIKELIITAGGENIPPVLVEEELKAAMPFLSNCMVIGDKRKFLTMLISLKCELNPVTGEPSDILAEEVLAVGRELGSSATCMSSAAEDPLWIEHINAGMNTANGRTTSNAQKVQKWKMLPVDFSEGAGDLTPTLKLKRSVVNLKYAGLIDSLYNDEIEA